MRRTPERKNEYGSAGGHGNATNPSGIPGQVANILAVKMSNDIDREDNTDTRDYRPLLAVRRIVQDVQTTTLVGDTLYGLANDIGNLDKVAMFNQYCAQFYNKCKKWGQLYIIPPPYNWNRFSLQPQNPPPQEPFQVAKLTLLASGFNVFQGGYWCQFAGNYNLYFDLFKSNWH